MPSLKITGKTKVFGTLTIPPIIIDNTSLLLKGEGQGGIIDSTGKNIINTFGNVTISTSVKKYGSGSIFFDGNEDYLQIPASSGFNFELEDFTIECWVNMTIGGEQYILDTRVSGDVNGIAFLISGQLGHGTGYYSYFSGATIPSNQWTHVAIVRNNGTLKYYVNGIAAPNTYSLGNMTTNGCRIGAHHLYPNSNNFNGYIDDLRVSKGIARYTSNFTPTELN